MILSSCKGQTGWRLGYMYVCEKKTPFVPLPRPPSSLSPQVPWTSLEAAGQGLCADLAPRRCSSLPHPAPQPTWEGKGGPQAQALLPTLQDSAKLG